MRATTSACEPPGRTLAEQGDLPLAVQAVNRGRPGPFIDGDEIVQTHPADLRRRHDHAAQAFDDARNSPVARTRTSYWSVPALKVETFCPATSVFSACAMSPTRTPKSPARARSILTRSSGLPVINVESASTTSGMVFIFSNNSSEYFVSF